MINPQAVPIRKTAIALGLAVLVAAVSSAQEVPEIKYRDGRFLETLGGVTLQRADEASSDEAVRNMPFLPGDRVWTDERGRAEIVFAEGEILWIAERSKVDSLGRGGAEQDERLGLRIFAGSFGARVRSGGPGFEFRAPGGSLVTTGAAAFRVDVRAGETVVSVSEGEVLVDLAGQRQTVRAGERVRYSDRAVEGPFAYQRAAADSFDRWCDERMAELNRMARNDDRLPDELDSYGAELAQNGDWVYDEPQGYVYVPRVAANWAPYTYGRWVYTLYGWTWVADEPWGFVTSHYGRWGYSSRVGWHWMPRSGFAGAWVGWSSPFGSFGNSIGWCALGFNDRPVGSFSFGGGGRAVARGAGRESGAGRGWSFANRSEMSRSHAQRRRVDLPEDAAQRAAVWSPGTAPDREFRPRTVARERGGAGGRGDTAARIYVRPSPGDSTPELRSDPTTTIPTPESRRVRTIGQDGFKEEQDNRRGGGRTNGSSLTIEEGGTSRGYDAARPRPNDRGTSNPRTVAPGTSSANDSARTEDNREQPKRDPLLSRFFRSITSPTSDREPGRETAPVRDDDSSARRREPSARDDDSAARRRETSARDDSSARESTPRDRSRSQERDRERARPSGAERERSRPAGVERERSQPRTPPAAQSSPRGGGGGGGSRDEGRASSRRPPKDN
jgi:hypothetical protein